MKNLIRLYLWPLIKRFKALFITMTVLTAIGVTSIIAFNGVADGMRENYKKYVERSDAPNAFLSTGLMDYGENGEKDLEIEAIEGVRIFERCMFVPCSTFLPKSQESKSTQLFTFDLRKDEYKPQIFAQTNYSKSYANVWVENSFAKLNDVKPGDTIQVGYYQQYVEVYVVGLLSYPDTVVYGASNAVSTENTNFGRIYIEKDEVKGLVSGTGGIVDKLQNFVDVGGLDTATKKAVEDAIELLNKFDTLISKEVQRFSNRITIYFDDNANQRETLNRVKDYYTSQGVKVLESYLFNESLSASLIDSNASAMKSAGRAVSIFVFGTVIIVLTMFLLQIIREMMRDIGVMSALGIKKEHIMGLLSLFSLIISIIGSAFGVFFGHLIEFGLDKIIGGVFGVAVKAPPFRYGNTLLSFATVLLASQFATFNASFRITKLMPVDALNDQASSKRVLSPKLEKKLQNARPGVRLTVNSIVTKPKRFITSFLAIFASGLIIFTSIASLTSFNKALNNTFDKYIRYDAQVVFADEPGGFDEELKSIGAERFEQTRYAAPVLKFNGKEETITLQGLPLDSTSVLIPLKRNEYAKVPEEGISVNMITAKALGIKEGDTVNVDGHDVKVAYISQLEAYNVCFCNVDKISEYANNDVMSYLINGVDKEALIKQVTNYHYDAVVTLTHDQRNYFASKFQILQMVCIVFIIFSVGLGVLIVSLMMQTSLIEQKRDLCIMRSVGFSMGQISGIWSYLMILQFIFSMVFSIPISFLATKLFLHFTNTKMAMVTSHANIFHMLITVGLVAAFLLISHFFCMGIVKRWNIAENTKNRE